MVASFADSNHNVVQGSRQGYPGEVSTDDS